ncbi:1,5-anhydro-D-fructose reductase isoform X1 [Musca domestica]|uniref:1,5-anhydro-D-fructose reductase isoform X1 n=2 Tax=Musca domestica TaxID=7370 RepID=A0A1I8MPE5_MUSDO|nr:1,5-anhydro-D-fructose reductase isoform X1 [Musca domestica]
MIQKFGRINLPFIRLGSPSNYHPTKLFENSGYKQFNLLNNKLILCLEDIFLKNAITTRQYSTPTHTKNSVICARAIFAELPETSTKPTGNSYHPLYGCYTIKRTFSDNCNKMAPTLAPKVKLNNGYEMPVLGLGTYESKNNEGEIAVKHAIDVGYRHIDTAYFYQNEAEIGKAIKDKIAEGVVKREDIFLVTKLWNIHHEPDRVEGACRKQLELLGLDYIDLYLMHLPVGYKYVNEETLLPKNDDGVLQLSDVDYLDTYKAMEKLVKLGLVRSIGVSNFNSEQLQRILDNCEIKPVTNQVECSPALNQRKLTQFCKERNITLTAYSPLGRPKPDEKKPEFYYSEKTKALADKYKKTPAQIILRYLVDIGVIPIPKSSNPKRIEENFNIFDFQLSPEDIAVMDTFHTGERLVPFNLIKGQNHKYWPFSIEF